MSAGSSGYDAIVIGAGHNGLITATYLAQAGRRTLVLDRSAEPGGCAATEELWPGYRVDIGAHGLGALDRRVVSDLGLDRAGLEFVEPDPLVAALQPDGPPLELHRDASKSAEAIRAFSERDAARWPDFVDAMAMAARVLAVLYESAPPRVAGADRGDIWEMVRLGAKLGRIGRAEAIELMRLLPMTVQEMLEEWFESDALLGALAARGCHGIAQGPMAAGTAFVLIHGLVGGSGHPRETRWVRGGMGRLGSVLADVARGAGVEVRLDAPVGAISIEAGGGGPARGAVRGVVLESGEEIVAPVVASSANPRHTLLELVDPAYLDPDIVRQVRNVRFRGVCAKVHLALDGLPSLNGRAVSASLCVAPGIHYLERAYDDAKHGAPSREPYLEVLIPSLLDPDVSPAGKHVASILVQYVPYALADGTWDETARASLADSVIATLDRHLPGLAARVAHRHVLTPLDLETRFGLAEGNIHHGEMTLDQAFVGRPIGGWARYATPIAGLHGCGAGTHPGGGLTGSPGANAAATILRGTRP